MLTKEVFMFKLSDKIKLAEGLGLTQESILNGIKYHYEIFESFLKGDEVQVHYAGGWAKTSTPKFSQSSKYRVLPQKFVGWKYIDDKINFLAADSSGVWRGFRAKPTATDLGDAGFWMSDYLDSVTLKGFKMPHVSKELWTHSLLTRPGFEDTE